MIYPNVLKDNGNIGVPAPSAGAWDTKKANKMLNAKKNLESLGYNLELSKNLLKCNMGRSASAEERANEINEMFKNKNIDLILCAAGGDFLVEILPYIDFNLLKENPKLVAGFSDPTGLLYPITTKYDIATIYGQNFSSFGAEKLHKCQEDFLEIVKGNLKEENSYELYEDGYQDGETGLEPYNLTKKVYWNTMDGKPAETTGRIIGGCFDIIAELAGTRFDGANEFIERYKEDGIIWYFDNCEQSKEETIRILWKMGELGYFKHTKGIIFGRFGLDTTTYGYTVETCLKDSILNKLNIPVIYDADITHKSPCITIINGSIATVDVKQGKGKITFEFV